MTNAVGTTTTEAAVVAEPGANVAPEKAASKEGSRQRKGAPRAPEATAVAEHGAQVAPEKTPSKKASSKKVAHQGQKIARAAKPKSPKKQRKPQPDAERPVAREGTVKAKVIAMLSRKDGATLDAIMKATGWQAHTTRGFISLLGSRHGIKVESTRREDGARVYAVR